MQFGCETKRHKVMEWLRHQKEGRLRPQPVVPVVPELACETCKGQRDRINFDHWINIVRGLKSFSAPVKF